MATVISARKEDHLKIPPHSKHHPRSHQIDSGAFWPTGRQICPPAKKGRFWALAVVGGINDQGFGSNGSHRHKPTPLNPDRESAIELSKSKPMCDATSAFY